MAQFWISGRIAQCNEIRCTVVGGRTYEENGMFRMKNVVGAMGLALSLVMVWPSSARAALAWYTAEVVMVGATASDQVLIQLTDLNASPDFDKAWFRATVVKENEMLAIAMMSETAGRNVLVQLDPAAPGYPEIFNMYLVGK